MRIGHLPQEVNQRNGDCDHYTIENSKADRPPKRNQRKDERNEEREQEQQDEVRVHSYFRPAAMS